MIIWKYQSIFAKGYIPNWSEVFVVKEVKNPVSWTHVVSYLNIEKFVGRFYEKDLQTRNQTEFKAEKVMNGKGW